MRPLACLTLAACLSPAPAAAETVTVVKTDDGWEFRHGDTPAGRYVTRAGVAKPYLWPVQTPAGVTVTRAWPIVADSPGTRDHKHHKSAWFCHGDVIPEGVEYKRNKNSHVKGIDFWSEELGHGVITCVSAEPGKGGSLRSLNEWRTAEGTVILTEERVIMLVPSAKGRTWAFDCLLTASGCPVTFGDTKEGAFGIRVHDALALSAKPSVGRLSNAEGKSGEVALWGYPSSWCDYAGIVEGKPAGVAVFDHPRNPSPAHWHARGYGLLAANPFGRAGSGFPGRKGQADLLKLAKGESARWRYAVYAHDGDTAAGGVAEAFAAFAR